MINGLIILCAYLIGSIPSGLWIGKIFYNTDIREHGSGNLGATNTFRTLGKKAGIVVTVMDVLKGTAAVLLAALPIFSDSSIHPLILGLVAVIGHMFPIFANFRGGKAVATSAGVLLGYSWPLFVLLLIAFLVTLKLTKIVSLTSMIAALVALIYSIVYYFVTGDFALSILVAFLFTFIIYRHRANIARIKNGTEPKVKWL
ncbi:glycerol-3-phosphate 1-O-acyltransferase PlsY [Lysinibacillus sp. RSDA_15]|uniref:glycerol-3-phosphate 1-O-acyltransferase PlsY n=1 Tax=Lysinibacillus TaxID=400634 RepID=UPI0004DF6F21|nr:glycerol-3-phosphate 1-O-acyltransferase PlsY [Lysinibacillus sphaericus]MBG9691072.1 glycerol-3-phosphate acyltransferase [Lysinibacillus sphaericus]MBG9754013.1 glycerol-3-phosphate acyltransferase [Lysinibacillus sphaericus]MEB7453163.1 glycerol-3-phosphate 1-O-acyltransferase PlsY [Lysinibacillus sphaericus]PIJ97479.1 glycerol-3-phosphate 1-O-acyltransferase PlsY [Lysinibacillus sphaericus]QIC45917.1 glycerol-3-phosphate 1-O-acyltransferase PlsY [Lysinibacillus sphaericus]